jgi:cell division protein FtsA
VNWHKERLKASVIPQEQRMIYLFEQCWQVDENVGIRNPIGLSGRTIKSAGHLVTDSESHIMDLENAIKRAFFNEIEHITQNDIKLIPVVASYASSLAVLTKEQKETGVALLDIGDSCSDLSVFAKKYPIKTWTTNIAGTTITKNIMNFLENSESEIEQIKKEYACANPNKTGNKEIIEVVSRDGVKKSLKLETLASLVYEPLKELFDNVRNTLDGNIDNTTYKKLISHNGIIITGGTANLREISSVAMEILETPAKTGKPNAERISEFPELNEDMCFSTLVGLCIHGTNNFSEMKNMKKKNRKGKIKQKNENDIKNIFTNLWDAFKNIRFS